MPVTTRSQTARNNRSPSKVEEPTPQKQSSQEQQTSICLLIKEEDCINDILYINSVYDNICNLLKIERLKIKQEQSIREYVSNKSTYVAGCTSEMVSNLVSDLKKVDLNNEEIARINSLLESLKEYCNLIVHILPNIECAYSHSFDIIKETTVIALEGLDNLDNKLKKMCT